MMNMTMETTNHLMPYLLSKMVIFQCLHHPQSAPLSDVTVTWCRSRWSWFQSWCRSPPGRRMIPEISDL